MIEGLMWLSTEAHKPNDGQIVIVSSGSAMYRDGKWYSGMEEPHYQREIQWSVRYWAQFPSAPGWIAP